MIAYIKALGFSQYTTKDKARKLIRQIINRPTNKRRQTLQDGRVKFQYYKEYGLNFGLAVHGEMDETNEKLEVQMISPLAEGAEPVAIYMPEFLPEDEQGVISCFCEDKKSGTPFSFYVQNADYQLEQAEALPDFEAVRLSVYSVDSLVILPVSGGEDESERQYFEELLSEARTGDEEAIDRLQNDAKEASKAVRDRLKTEDILTVVESYFFPMSDYEDVYSFLGKIVTQDKLTNDVTGEEIYRFVVKSMAIEFALYINAQDLVGQPQVGFRIKGVGWLQGELLPS